MKQGDGKFSREQHRLKMYGGPQVRPWQPCFPRDLGSGTGAAPSCTLSTDRAIIQFDADAFYAQVLSRHFIDGRMTCFCDYS